MRSQACGAGSCIARTEPSQPSTALTWHVRQMTMLGLIRSRLPRETRLLFTGVALIFFACKEGPAGPSNRVVSVSISPPTVSLEVLGATTQLTATALSSAGTAVTGRSFTWSSSNLAVAAVSTSGLVTAAGNGAATITASTEGVSGTSSVAVSLRITIAAVSAGFDHTCAVSVSGIAYCWGVNTFGQLGDGSTTRRLQPSAVQTNARFSSIAAGQAHTCAVTQSGAGYCWGASDQGQVGDGGLGQRTAPARVVRGLLFAAIEAGHAHTCGITTRGTIRCWGWGSNGELGNGQIGNRVAPDSVLGGGRYTTVKGTAHTVCGIRTTGQTECWGRNNTGQVGDGTTSCTSLSSSCFAERSVPTRVLTNALFVSVSSGARLVNGFGGGTSCGVTAAGVGYCWGQNANGQIGDASQTHASRRLSFSATASGEWSMLVRPQHAASPKTGPDIVGDSTAPESSAMARQSAA